MYWYEIGARNWEFKFREWPVKYAAWNLGPDFICHLWSDHIAEKIILDAWFQIIFDYYSLVSPERYEQNFKQSLESRISSAMFGIDWSNIKYPWIYR